MTEEEYQKIEEKVELAGWITRVVMIFNILSLIGMNGGSHQFFSSLRSL